MALIKCKECGHEISKTAQTCPNCGAKNIQAGLITQVAIWIFIFFIIWTFLIEPTKNILSDASVTSTEPVLEVISWKCDTSYGHTSVSGEVKNISGKSIENVMAVGNFKTKDGTFVKSADALIEYNPILAGQISPFKAMTANNPAIENCELAFKKLAGGTLKYKMLKK